MTTELRMLTWSALLGLVHIVLAATAAGLQYGAAWSIGPRDIPRPPLTGVAGRLCRASRNFMETFPFYAVAILVGDAVNEHGAAIVFGSRLYFWGRVAYLPLYAVGLPIARSVAWVLATLGIVVVILALL
jgi:uncharacterized MAPEG superfamily protein